MNLFLFHLRHGSNLILLFFNRVSQDKTVKCLYFPIFDQLIDLNFKGEQFFIRLRFYDFLHERFEPLASGDEHIEVNRNEQKRNHQLFRDHFHEPRE